MSSQTVPPTSSATSPRLWAESEKYKGVVASGVAEPILCVQHSWPSAFRCKSFFSLQTDEIWFPYLVRRCLIIRQDTPEMSASLLDLPAQLVDGELLAASHHDVTGTLSTNEVSDERRATGSRSVGVGIESS